MEYIHCSRRYPRVRAKGGCSLISESEWREDCAIASETGSGRGGVVVVGVRLWAKLNVSRDWPIFSVGEELNFSLSFFRPNNEQTDASVCARRIS